MGILEILTIIFTVLRGLGFTDWPWVCCFIPEMIAVVIYIICVAVHVSCQIRTARHIRDKIRNLEEFMEDD